MTRYETLDETPAHDCGLCDGPIQFAGHEGGYRTWKCTAPDCGWWHTSKDCCTTPGTMPNRNEED